MKITLKILKADGSGIKDKQQMKKYLFKKIMKILQQRQESMVFEPRQFTITPSPTQLSETETTPDCCREEQRAFSPLLHP